ncbi:hypothetical protein RB653_002911 [Dictyostelium firmibasis]|uniref:Uncharacterized protein n=1 Tax=Dictyostelium firmibasis TaxID=79012 RepID=A0AAN7TYE5_9MYCE
MNYSNLLQRLNITVEPLEKRNENYKSIETMIANGSLNEDNYTVECIDCFTATRSSDNSKDFTSDKNNKQTLLWYGCYNSSVAAKLLNGITPSYNSFTSYKSISCWDNISGCLDSISMSKFYRDKTTSKFQPNLGILMLVEVNHKAISMPSLIKIDTIKSEDYTKNVLEYNEDDDTEDEADGKDCILIKDDNDDKNNNKKEKYVYCKEINDQIDRDHILQITGEFSPEPNNNSNNNNTSISNNRNNFPIGKPIPSTKIIKGNGWLNGYLKVWGKYNQYLVPSNSMIKLKYLVIIKTTPTNKYIKNKSMSPSKQSTSTYSSLLSSSSSPKPNNNNNNNNSNNNSNYNNNSSNNNNNNSNNNNNNNCGNFKNDIWGSVLTVKKRTNDQIINLDDDDNTNNNDYERGNKKTKK